MTALATTEDLAKRLPFIMDEDDEREAIGALDDLSDDARYYGKPHWETPEVTPQPVINLILKAVKAHMLNYHGYVQSRAGDETVTWNDEAYTEPGRCNFTGDEITRIREYAGSYRSGLHSVNTFTASRKRVVTTATSRPVTNPNLIPEAPW